MFKLRVESQFSGAHQLRSYPGACNRIHGHNWKVKVTILSRELNELGMVLDLLELQKFLDECLQQFDHRLINEIEPFDQINPTSENLAKYIYKWFEQKMPPGINVGSVEVYETDHFSVTYER